MDKDTIRYIECGAGVRVPASDSGGVAEFFDESVGKISMKVVYDEDMKRLVADSVQVTRTGRAAEVTGVKMRSVRVEEYLRTAGMHMAQIRSDNGEWKRAAEYLSDLENTTPSDVDVTAARIYVLARIISGHPLKTVGRYLNVSQSTATRIVARARARGLVD
jgi:hypothetical protein